MIYTDLEELMKDNNIIIKNGLLYAEPKQVLDMSGLTHIEEKEFYVLCCIAKSAGYTQMKIKGSVIPPKANDNITQCLCLRVLDFPMYQGIKLIFV